MRLAIAKNLSLAPEDSFLVQHGVEILQAGMGGHLHPPRILLDIVHG